MSLVTAKPVSRRTWDEIPMPDSVIQRVNELGKDQPEQFIFTDRKGRAIGDIEPAQAIMKYALDQDDPLEITGVDGDENETPQIPPEPEEIQHNPFPTDTAPIQEDPGVEMDIVPDDNRGVEPPLIQAEIPVAPTETTPAPPDQIPGVWRSTQVKFQTKDYIPSLSGSSKYAFAIHQIEQHHCLHPDAHMLFQTDMYRHEPDVVAAIMTQLSLKAGLKAWGKEARTAVH
jgi:hypothetical protein